jgi:hypothetical protein
MLLSIVPSRSATIQQSHALKARATRDQLINLWRSIRKALRALVASLIADHGAN